MKSVTNRSLLAVTVAPLALAATPAFAASDNATEAAEQDRDYLPTTIVVVGQKEGYGGEDGSSGTKTETALLDVPQSITVLTEDQLEDQSLRQLNDALRYVPGITLETGEGHRDEVFIRGQETTADFYLDGLRDDAQYFRPLYNVERVEVLKGPNALIFGRGGGGGAINRVSKTADVATRFVNLDASVDTFSAFALTGDVNLNAAENLGLRVTGTYEEFDNDRDFYEGRFIGITPTITARLGANTRLTAHYTYDDDRRVTDRGVPSLGTGPLTGYDETFFGVPGFNEARAEVHIARSRIDHDFSDDLHINASVQYANYDKVYANVLPRGTDGETVSLGGYQDFTQRENLIGQANLVWETKTGPLDHMLLVGIEGSVQDTQNGRYGVALSRNFVFLTDPYDFPEVSLTPISRSRDSELKVFSAYVQDQISFGEFVEVIAGLRYDRFDLDTYDILADERGQRVDELVSPRLGLIVKPGEGLSFYASYAESFLPQAGDQFTFLDPAFDELEPEKFTSYEIGVKFAPKTDLLFTAALFQLDRTNTRSTDPLTNLAVLTGESRVRGGEASIVGNILPVWQASLGYAYLDGEILTDSIFADAGTTLQQTPHHQFTAWNRFYATDRLSFGLGGIYRSEQFTSYTNEVILPDFLRIDAAAYYEVNERVTVQLNIENLFDEDYYASAHGDNNIQPGDPFHARIGVRFGF
ncbi:TonB-dependent siderophore receptor [Altererythrobacter aurantiacus]|uniref:TonB-dependent siderophore receptor n=1 Tax=Parapontixanthobacter aurantiacus TaxID=1463599 RepID=A0A844ZBF7_9SPHN|nr:TonB-dependent siderophore receptor [Parapontixanthobacter aurantiacus]MXO84526.1 TonB-dependent siderophore receptor [Parapontixanthobacter aurantiacus]